MTERQEVNFRFNLYDKKKRFNLIVKILLGFIFLGVFYCLFMTLVLNQYSKYVSNDALTYYFEKSPDIIAVFTGDRGRLEYAFKLIEQHPEAKLLISGVYTKNTIQTLLNSRKINISESINEANVSQIVELDYHARNTIENVLMTLQYIKHDPTYKKILIISSDYHLLRIKLIVNMLNKDNTLESIQYYGVKSEMNLMKRIYDSAFEGFKILRSIFFSFFWISDEMELQN